MTIKELLLDDSPTERPQLPRQLIDALRAAMDADLSVEQIAAAIHVFAGLDAMAQTMDGDELVERAKRMHDAMMETTECLT